MCQAPPWTYVFLFFKIITHVLKLGNQSLKNLNNLSWVTQLVMSKFCLGSNVFSAVTRTKIEASCNRENVFANPSFQPENRIDCGLSSLKGLWTQGPIYGSDPCVPLKLVKMLLLQHKNYLLSKIKCRVPYPEILSLGLEQSPGIYIFSKYYR